MENIYNFNKYIKEEYRKGSNKFSGLIHDIMLFLRNYENIGDELIIPLSEFLNNVNINIDELKEFIESDYNNLISFNIKIDNNNIIFYNLNNVSKKRLIWETIQEKLLPKKIRYEKLLYHSTTYENFYNILKTNKLFGTDDYDYGIATSRNRYYLHHISEYGDLEPGKADCQIILNRDKIKNNYKIKPFDWENYKRRQDQKYHQSEDKILTNVIYPIDKYIIGIQLNNNPEYNFRFLKKSKYWKKIEKNNWIIFDNKWNILYS
jgi:hypothetical protein